MAKYLIPYKKLIETFEKGNVPNNILLSVREKVLLDDILKVICENFGGKDFDVKNNLISFNAEDKQMDNVLNECSNIGLFSEKKVVVLKDVKRVQKDARISLISYLKRSNPDACLIMTSPDEEFTIDKIFNPRAKGDSDFSKDNKETVEKNVRIYQIDEFTEPEMVSWIEDKFEGYKISKETIKHLLHFTNYTFDEILSEIDKLKTFCYDIKEVTTDAVNLCNGISKDFNEFDFIRAITERKPQEALRIYDHISLKKDSEVYLVFLMSNAFTVINKLYDPNTARLNGFNLKRELKIWYQDQEMLLPYYRKFGSSTNQEQIQKAFEYIYDTDKLLKSSGSNKKTMIISLINNICNL